MATAGEPLFDVHRFVVHNLETEKVELTPEGAVEIAGADVILAEDPAKGSRYVLRGRDELERIKASGRAEQLIMLRVRVDDDTDDLERMAAAVEVVHGKHDLEEGDLEEGGEA